MHNQYGSIMKSSLLVGLLCGLMTPVQSARAELHPFHISVAEAEWNPETDRLEVSLKLHAVDLERALTRQGKRKVNLETDQEAEQLCTSYLEQHFFLTLRENVPDDPSAEIESIAKENRSRIKLIGREFDKTWLLLYFEMKLPSTLAKAVAGKTTENGASKAISDGSNPADVAGNDWVLVNTILLDLTPGQINTATIRHGFDRYALKTHDKTRWLPFECQWVQRQRTP